MTLSKLCWLRVFLTAFVAGVNGLELSSESPLLNNITVTCKGTAMTLEFDFNSFQGNYTVLTLSLKNDNYPHCQDMKHSGTTSSNNSTIVTMQLEYEKCPAKYHSSAVENYKFLQLELSLKTFNSTPSSVIFGPNYIKLDFIAQCQFRIESMITFSNTLFSGYGDERKAIELIPVASPIPNFIPAKRRDSPKNAVAARKSVDTVGLSTNNTGLKNIPFIYRGNGDDISGLTANLLARQDDPTRNLSFAYQGLKVFLQIGLNITKSKSYTKVIPVDCYFSKNKDPQDYSVISPFITSKCADISINQFAHVVSLWNVTDDTTYQVHYKMLTFDNNPTVYLHCSLQFCIPMDSSCVAAKTPACGWK